MHFSFAKRTQRKLMQMFIRKSTIHTVIGPKTIIFLRIFDCINDEFFMIIPVGFLVKFQWFSKVSFMLIVCIIHMFMTKSVFAMLFT